MKEKTSISLSRDVLREVDRIAGDESRSAFIERVLSGHLRELAREKRDARDLDRLNAAADRFNAEAREVLRYQASWPEE